MQATKYQFYAHNLINIVFFFKHSKQCIRPHFLEELKQN